MLMRYLTSICVGLLIFTAVAAGQTKPKPQPAPTASTSVKTTPAYAELILRKTDLSSELEALLVEYTEEYPKVKELKFHTAALQKEIDRLNTVADVSRLSAALGRMMIRKCELATELFQLQADLNDQHPDVKRAKRRVEVFEAAITEILTAK